ncbi:MAG: hypothetical protein AAFO81_15270 [Pseudomonadota bacterium]
MLIAVTVVAFIAYLVFFSAMSMGGNGGELGSVALFTICFVTAGANGGAFLNAT